MSLLLDDQDKWITIDPGESTGWARWLGTNLVEAGQTPMWEYVDSLWATVREESIRLVVCEDWVLYPWKAQELGWNPCRTARAIGAVQFITRTCGVNLVLQAAKIKEGAVAAGAENLYIKPLHPNRHANDAIQHGVYYLATRQGVRL